MCSVNVKGDVGRSPEEEKDTTVRESSHMQKLAWLAIAGAFPFFFVGGPGPHAGRAFTAAWNLGHIGVFILVSFIILKRLQLAFPQCPVWVRVVVVFLSVAVLGGSIELLQYWEAGRSPSVGDMARNLLGGFIGIVFLGWGRQKIPEKSLFCLRSVAVLLVCVATWPFVRALVDATIARAQFPVLSSFETPFEQYRWKKLKQIALDDTVARQGEKSLKVQLTTKQYSGVSLSYFPRDWRQYKKLCLSVYNPDPTELILNGRIHDASHGENGHAYSDRFNRQFTLNQGWNDFQIALDEVRMAPMGRTMDMQKIEAVKVFVMEQPHPRVIYIDNLYLEK